MNFGQRQFGSSFCGKVTLCFGESIGVHKQVFGGVNAHARGGRAFCAASCCRGPHTLYRPGKIPGSLTKVAHLACFVRDTLDNRGRKKIRTTIHTRRLMSQTNKWNPVEHRSPSALPLFSSRTLLAKSNASAALVESTPYSLNRRRCNCSLIPARSIPAGDVPLHPVRIMQR